jgi:hypothetical protein
VLSLKYREYFKNNDILLYRGLQCIHGVVLGHRNSIDVLYAFGGPFVNHNADKSIGTTSLEVRIASAADAPLNPVPSLEVAPSWCAVNVLTSGHVKPGKKWWALSTWSVCLIVRSCSLPTRFHLSCCEITCNPQSQHPC